MEVDIIMTIKAVMDIGTNSTRLVIGRYNSVSKKIEVLHRELATTRIGEELVRTNLLSQKGQQRTLKSLLKYKELIHKYAVKEIILVATSAVRDALNGKEFCIIVYNLLGWHVNIISGQEEAFLSYLGAVESLELYDGKTPLVLDIGGGSTEISWVFNNQILARSAPIGAVRLKEKEIAEDEIGALLRYHWGLNNIPSGKLIGVGGTATTLAAITQKMEVYQPQKVQGYQLSIAEIAEINNYLISLSLEARKKVPGLLSDRADIIVYGIKILLVAMNLMKAKKIVISDADLLFGLFFHDLETLHIDG